MKILMLLPVLLIVVGCDEYHTLTRAEVIAGVEECKQAGLDPVIRHSGFTNSPWDVQCEIPKEVTK